MDKKLTCDESEDLEKDLTINEIKKIICSMKQYKSPGLDGIINEFYQIYWDTIKEDLFEVLLEIFDKFEICDSQCRGMLTLLHLRFPPSMKLITTDITEILLKLALITIKQTNKHFFNLPQICKIMLYSFSSSVISYEEKL